MHTISPVKLLNTREMQPHKGMHPQGLNGVNLGSVNTEISKEVV